MKSKVIAKPKVFTSLDEFDKTYFPERYKEDELIRNYLRKHSGVRSRILEVAKQEDAQENFGTKAAKRIMQEVTRK
jgi:hypothetical protein